MIGIDSVKKEGIYRFYLKKANRGEGEGGEMYLKQNNENKTYIDI